MIIFKYIYIYISKDHPGNCKNEWAQVFTIYVTTTTTSRVESRTSLQSPQSSLPNNGCPDYHWFTFNCWVRWLPKHQLLFESPAALEQKNGIHHFQRQLLETAVKLRSMLDYGIYAPSQSSPPKQHFPQMTKRGWVTWTSTCNQGYLGDSRTVRFFNFCWDGGHEVLRLAPRLQKLGQQLQDSQVVSGTGWPCRGCPVVGRGFSCKGQTPLDVRTRATICTVLGSIMALIISLQLSLLFQQIGTSQM